MAHRTFRDHDGVQWEVWSVTPTLRVDGSSAPGTLLSEETASGWLAFQGPREKRRFYQVPQDWEQFTDQQLCVLLKHSVIVPSLK
jgi:hypothetical protein